MESLDTYNKPELICRTCGCQTDDLISISSFHTLEDTAISEVLTRSAAVQVHDENSLPQQMCKKCIDELSTTVSFKKRCEERDFMLKDTQLHRKTENLNSTVTQIKIENPTSPYENEYETSTVCLKEEPNDPFCDLEFVPSIKVKVEEDVVQYRCEQDDIFSDDLGSFRDLGKPDNLTQGIADPIENANEPKLDIDNRSKSKPKKTGNKSEPKLFHCHMCNYTARKKYILKNHIMSHTGERPFKCDLCDFSTIQRSYLINHVKGHTGEKSFRCHLCEFTCIGKGDLKVHIMRHTGEKPFKCDICDYCCRRKNELNNHMLSHTTEKPFQCDLCSYTCVRRVYLKRHMVRHSKFKPFKCEVCTLRFFNQSEKKQHMLIHSEDKPFACEFCDYKSYVSRYLKNHSRIHTREKKLKCDECDYSCSLKTDIKRHVKTHYVPKVECMLTIND